MKIKVSNVNTPNWKDVNVKSHIPAELEKLSELTQNNDTYIRQLMWSPDSKKILYTDRKNRIVEIDCFQFGFHGSFFLICHVLERSPVLS